MAALAAAREAANAMRALRPGSAASPPTPPPALYSYDPDTGRLAVTTPGYNTAIVAINHGAQPYGGLDLARLFDGRQERRRTSVASTPRVRPAGALSPPGALLRTQYGHAGAGRDPLAAPHARGAAPGGARVRAYAGPFTDLRVRGRVRRGALQATSEYRFTPVAIEGRWSVTGAAASPPSRSRAGGGMRDDGDAARRPRGDRAAAAARRDPLAAQRPQRLPDRALLAPRGGRVRLLPSARPELGARSWPDARGAARRGPCTLRREIVVDPS